MPRLKKTHIEHISNTIKKGIIRRKKDNISTSNNYLNCIGDISSHMYFIALTFGVADLKIIMTP